MSEQNGFLFLGSFMESIEAMDKINENLGDELALAIVGYGIEGEKNYSSFHVQSVMCNIEKLIDKNAEKYKDTVRKTKVFTKLHNSDKLNLSWYARIDCGY